MTSPVRIFVGTDPNGHDAESCMVLEHSLRSRTAAAIEFTWMHHSKDPASPWHGWDGSKWATTFSGFRWGIPAACDFQGRGIYMDSDMIGQADILDLWQQPMPAGKVMLARSGGRTCVALWDCERAGRLAWPDRPTSLWLDVLRREPLAHANLLARFRTEGMVATFDGLWNYLDTENREPLDQAKIVHYTDMSCQPHHKYAVARLAAVGQKHWYNGKVRPHPRPDVQALFDREYAAAIRAGLRVADYVPSEAFGTVRKADLTHYRGRAA